MQHAQRNPMAEHPDSHCYNRGPARSHLVPMTLLPHLFYCLSLCSGSVTCRCCLQEGSVTCRWRLQEGSVTCRCCLQEGSVTCRCCLQEGSVTCRCCLQEGSVTCRCCLQEGSVRHVPCAGEPPTEDCLWDCEARHNEGFIFCWNNNSIGVWECPFLRWALGMYILY